MKDVIIIEVLEKKPRVKKYEDYIRVVQWRKNNKHLETVKTKAISLLVGSAISLISLYSIAEMANLVD